MVNNLLQEKSEKEAALAELRRQILAGHDNPDALRKQVQELERELSAIQSKLDDKQEKLSEADRKLDALREEMTAMKERTESCGRRHTDIPILSDKVRTPFSEMPSRKHGQRVLRTCSTAFQ